MGQSATDDLRAYVADCAMSLKIMAETLRVFGGAGLYPGLNGRGQALIEFGNRIDPIASAMQDFASKAPTLGLPPKPFQTDE